MAAPDRHPTMAAVRAERPRASVIPDPDPTVVPTPETGPDQPFEPAPVIPDPNPNREPAPIIPDPDPNREPAPIIPEPGTLSATADRPAA